MAWTREMLELRRRVSRNFRLVASVGQDGRNLAADVKKVQVLLSALPADFVVRRSVQGAQAGDAGSSSGFLHYMGTAGLQDFARLLPWRGPCNGLCTAELIRAIYTFQRTLPYKGGVEHRIHDARVDPNGQTFGALVNHYLNHLNRVQAASTSGLSVAAATAATVGRLPERWLRFLRNRQRFGNTGAVLIDLLVESDVGRYIQ